MTRFFAVLAMLMLAIPGAVQAQGLTTSALKGLDNKSPIDVDADSVDVLDQENQAIFRGHVHVRQNELSLQADRVKVFYSRGDSASPTIQRLDADGSVRLLTASESATARFGIYDVDRRLLTLVGNVVLVQGTTRVAGNRLVINLESGRSTLDGSSTGQGSQRVTGHFAIPDRKTSGK